MRVLCRRTTPDDFGRNRWADISIHVLRVEDDSSPPASGKPCTDFNPRPPCGGRLFVHCVNCNITHFNPRPPCGGRLASQRFTVGKNKFQSTSSVWRTTLQVQQSGCVLVFQSTSSVWRTTDKVAERYTNAHISIHVLRVEDDRSKIINTQEEMHFNPRPPCGGRRTAKPAYRHST